MAGSLSGMQRGARRWQWELKAKNLVAEGEAGAAMIVDNARKRAELMSIAEAG